jgi:hypothetical protein
MVEPAQSDESPAAANGGVDSTVKIEQLLLSGLDHYFRGRFEHAIDVWTRVLFLDRSHARARAYIDRARASVAERLRESEALLHAGVEACDRGDVAEARALLTSAVERGGAHDDALAVLERVARIEAVGENRTAATARRRSGAQRARRAAVTVTATGRRFGMLPWLLLVAAFATATVVLFVAGSWAQLVPVRLADQTGMAAVPQGAPPAPLQVPSLGQLALERAKALVADDRRADALSVLDTVGHGDVFRGEVDTLRAEIQRELLTRSLD